MSTSDPHHSIPFTLRDHLHACLAGWPTLSSCFPASRSSRRLFNSSSSSSLASDDGRLHLPRDSLRQSSHDRHQEDDIAAWGSDALSLRSHGGKGRSSRQAGRKGMGWIWSLIAGRRSADVDPAGVIDRADVEAEDSDEEQGILGGWGGEADWDELPPPRRGEASHEDETPLSPPDFDLGNSSDFDDDPDEREVGEGEWGAFLSAPISSGPRRSRSPSPAARRPSTPDLSVITSPPHPHPHPHPSLPLPSSLSLPSDLSTLPHSPAAADDPPADLGSEYLAPKPPSSRRSYTSSAQSTSTSSSHRSRSTATTSTSQKIPGEADPDAPSPSNLYGAGNPFSFREQEEEAKRKKEERKERKRARRARREERDRERKGAEVVGFRDEDGEGDL